VTDLKDLNQPLISINETTNDHKKPPLAALQQPSNDPGRALVKRLNAERKDLRLKGCSRRSLKRNLTINRDKWNSK
jgi:hypothetical protein